MIATYLLRVEKQRAAVPCFLQARLVAAAALDGTANATQAQRQLCGAGCAGLMPVSGGDGGLPRGRIFVQEAGALFGVQAAVSAATAASKANLLIGSTTRGGTLLAAPCSPFQERDCRTARRRAPIGA